MDRTGLFSTSPTDAQLAQFLGRAGFNCGSWSIQTLAKKRIAVSRVLPLQYGSNQYVAIDAFVRAVDAYCLKLAIQRTNAPVAARPYTGLRPAGQATTPVGLSPMTAGVIGFAIGGIVSFLVLR